MTQAVPVVSDASHTPACTLDCQLLELTVNELTLSCPALQIMRFDITPLPPGQIAQPFTLERQVALNAALIADWVANVPPIAITAAPARQVRMLNGWLCYYPMTRLC